MKIASENTKIYQVVKKKAKEAGVEFEKISGQLVDGTVCHFRTTKDETISYHWSYGGALAEIQKLAQESIPENKATQGENQQCKTNKFSELSGSYSELLPENCAAY